MVKRKIIGHLTYTITLDGGVELCLYDGLWPRRRVDIHKLVRRRARALDPGRPALERRSRMRASYGRRRR